MDSVDFSENDGFSHITEEEAEVKNLFKIVFLGNSGVGKTNIMCRFTTNSFNINSKPTIGVDFGIKTIVLNDSLIKLQLWDTAGQERYQTYTSAYFKDALGLIIVYDISNAESFKSVGKWIQIAKDHVDLRGCSLLLVGNKIDLENQRQVNKIEAQDFADKEGVLFVETSAFEDENNNITKAIKMLVKSSLRRHPGKTQLEF